MNDKTLKNIGTTIILITIAVFALLLVACSTGTKSVQNPPPKVEETKKPEEKEPPTEQSYNIVINFNDGNITPSQQEIFVAAAKTWQKIITADLKDVTASIPAGKCEKNDPGFSGTIDDIVISASAPNLDGPGGVLGLAGPCGMRSSTTGTGLPFYGLMAFDSSDIADAEANGTLKNIILHEMGHVLGLGTLWAHFDLLAGINTNDPTFLGSHAVKEWHTLGGNGNVPVENKGGIGTKHVHWRESVFNTELMTGFSDPTQQLSRLTIASLKDLSYSVDFSIADSYTLPSSLVTSANNDNGHLHSVPTTIMFVQ